MNNGGSAFPYTIEEYAPYTKFFPGMTLLDFFAAKAMQHMAMPTTGKFDLNGNWKMEEVTQEVLDSMSRLSYRWAKSMLKAREEA